MNSGVTKILVSGLTGSKGFQFSSNFKISQFSNAFSTSTSTHMRTRSKTVKNPKLAWFQENWNFYSVPKDIKPEDLEPVQYIGKNGSPFPLNPLFKPVAPFPEELKKKMYEANLKDPALNTPRRLAIQYRISIRRAEAILKLKYLETAMTEKGFVPLTNYQVGMERLLGSHVKLESEHLETINPKLGKPLYVAVEEGVDFDPKDAANLLQRPEFTDTVDRLLKDKVFTFRGISGKDYGIETEKKPEPISEDPILGTHRAYDFMFSDINPNLSPKDQTVLIREKNGVLREATMNERFFRARRTGWLNQYQHFRRSKSSKIAA